MALQSGSLRYLMLLKISRTESNLDDHIWLSDHSTKQLYKAANKPSENAAQSNDLGKTTHGCSLFKEDSFLLAKSLMLTGKFWVISTDPEQPPSMAIKHIIKRSYNKYGVFLDYDCPNGQECISQVNNIPMENLKEELLKPENRKMDAMATYNYRIFQMLEQTYNFSVDIKPSKFFGYVVENGKLEGLTLMLKNHEVDFSVSAILINRARYRCMDFVSTPTWEFRIVTLFRHPPVTGAYGAVLLTPFEMNVWTSCAGMWVIVIVVIRFVSWVETSTFDFVASSHEEETVRSWSDTLMIIIGAVSEQGTTMDSKWVAWRTAFLAAFILSMMVNINYGASLVSSLLSTPVKTIRTTRDLIDSSLQFAAEDISYSVPYFALNKDPLVQELYQKKMAPPNQAYYSRDVALSKMRKERFAFHTEALKVFREIEDTFSEKEKCDLSEVLIFPPEKCYLAIPWGSPHKEMFSVANLAESTEVCPHVGRTRNITAVLPKAYSSKGLLLLGVSPNTYF
ncbi:hypothetical protein Cfor_04319 [Coptotermes formosanus]|uniref:Ionotropic glutamate receptor C-terminal domain-containing protein n=1 Tax=Coptotermes formosanus TaxID=36987 RepID=A0A6L2PJC0_COPFO|nr:hypothetical protein Cfor_04319 [Coptotermes formosanus]